MQAPGAASALGRAGIDSMLTHAATGAQTAARFCQANDSST
jgi:hypothetical protein